MIKLLYEWEDDNKQYAQIIKIKEDTVIKYASNTRNLASSPQRDFSKFVTEMEAWQHMIAAMPHELNKEVATIIYSHTFTANNITKTHQLLEINKKYYVYRIEPNLDAVDVFVEYPTLHQAFSYIMEASEHKVVL